MENKQGTPLTFEKFLEFYDSHFEPRFAKLEEGLEKLDEDFKWFRNEVSEKFDYVFKQIETLHQEYTVIKEQLKRIEENQRVDRQTLSNLKSQIADLQRRVEALEAQA